MLSTIDNFKKAKAIIDKIETINLKNEKSLISIYNIENEISLWELAKPVINIHVIPGIISKNNSYKFYKIILKSIYTHFSFRSLGYNKTSTINPNQYENIFTCFTKYIHDDILIPFKLSKQNLNYNVINDYDNSAIECINVSKYWSQELHLEGKRLISKLTSFKNIINIFKITKLLAENDIKLMHYFKLHFWLTGYFLNKYISYIIIAKRFTSENSIKNLIELDISDPRSRIFSIYAKKNKIKVTTLQFAFYYRDSYEWFHCISDMILTWGSWFDKVFIDFYGIDNKKIEIVGSPRFDKYLLDNIKNTIDSQEKSVLIISSYDIPAYKNITNTIPFRIYLETIIQILLKNNYKIFIKIHPLELDTSYLLKYDNKNLKIIDIEEFDQTLNKVEFVVSHGSSLTFSALILNKSILYPTSKEVVWWDDVFANNNLGIGFDSFNYFESLVQDISAINALNISKKDILASFIFFDKNQTSSNKILNLLS